MSTAVLEIKGISKTMGKRKVVDNVSFTVNAGEVFGFLGPNGAGKTTTIKMALGLLSIDAGEVFINGHSVKKEYEKALEQVGGIIENPKCMGISAA
ncbi:MAG: ATP-binding cassette domain-containing protein [Oscillospiraceae bacterium]